jgi:hypothetical protein
VIMIDNIIIALDVITVLLVSLLFILSYKLIHTFDKCGGRKPWWFYLLPTTFVYGFVCRSLLLLIVLGYLPESSTDVVVAMYAMFYVGLIGFIHGMNLICDRIVAKRKI